MRNRLKNILLIGDRDPGVIAHQAIPQAIALAAPNGGFQTSWLPTTEVCLVGGAFSNIGGERRVTIAALGNSPCG
jgi:hypothetical protein